jgi:hypothetical protein
MQILHFTLSTFAVENSCAFSYMVRERNKALVTEGNVMRLVESTAAGIVVLAAQILVVATVMI